MSFLRTFIVVLAIIVSGCAHHQKLPPEEVHTIYVAAGKEDTLLSKYAPVFLTYDYQNQYNRIGRPSARFDEKGDEYIYVDVEKPVIYYLQEEFSTEKGEYTNLIYRIHFPRVPFSLIPFYITSGYNVGIIVVITLDSRKRPVLVSSVGTCGCYIAIVPTTYLARDALPEDWEEKTLDVYGERLPWILDYNKEKQPKVFVFLRPGVHRVMNLEIIDGESLLHAKGFKAIQAPMEPTSALKEIPLNGKTTSFYYDYGPQKGHVKRSMKFWETLMLSLISFDLLVGADKVYGENDEYGNPFYTSLKPWNRKASDMSNFPRFLKFWGWRL
jgi:hypothetical protein